MIVPPRVFPYRATVSRRAALQLTAGATAAALLAACGDEAAPTATMRPALSPTAGAVATATTGATTAPATMLATRPAATAPAVAASVAGATSGATAASAPTAVAAAASAPATPAPAPAAMGTDGKFPSPAPGVPDAYTKTPNPTKSVAAVPGKGGKVTMFLGVFGSPPPTPREKNVYWQELEKRLGATLEITVAPSQSYSEKIAAITAGGDIPDLTWLRLEQAPDQHKVIQQGAYTDLTPFLTGSALKEFPNLALFPEQLWKNVAIKGKIYGVPRPAFLSPVSPMFYRRDWAEKVGIPEPKNAEQFFDLMVRFTRDDPDGNGKRDSYGLSQLIPVNGGMLPFVSWMFRVPNEWRKNPDGTLTNAIETEEFRQALAFGRRLWEAGVFHPDAPTLMFNQAKDGFAGGTFGTHSEGTVALIGLREQARMLNPAADLRALIPPGHDGSKAFAWNNSGYFGFVAIPAKVGRDRERVRELLRLLDYYAAPFGSEEQAFLENGIEGLHHKVEANGKRVQTDQGKADLSGMRSHMNEVRAFYSPTPGEAQIPQQMVRDYLAIGVDNPALTAYSPSYASRAGELSRLNTDRLNDIVTGRAPLTALDVWIKDWRSRGGDQARKEFEQELRAT